MFGKGEKVMINGIFFNVNFIVFLVLLNEFFFIWKMFKKFEIVKNVCVLNVCLVIYSCKIYKLNV